MEKNQYKLIIANGQTSKAVMVNENIFKNWILKDYKIGSICTYEDKKYEIRGGNARDGTPMHKMCSVRGFKRLKVYKKGTGKKVKNRKRFHSAYVSQHIGQIFLKPL